MQNNVKQKNTEAKNNLIEEYSIVQLIVFLAGNEEFGVPIDAVREIIKMTQITPIPASTAFIKGIINVRGEIVTTVDIKSRFDLLDKSENEEKHIVVTKQEGGLFGLIVDEVVEVLRIQSSDIKPAPDLITKINKRYINGIVTHNDRLIILLDLAEVLSQKDLMHISKSEMLPKKIKSKKNKTRSEPISSITQELSNQKAKKD